MKDKIIGVIGAILLIIVIAIFAGGTENVYMKLHQSDYSIDEDVFYDKTESTDPGTYYSNQLIEYEKIIYKKLMENKENLKKGNYVIDFGYTFTERLNRESIPMMSSDGSSTLKDQPNDIDVIEAAKYAETVFLIENPDMYFIDMSKLVLHIDAEKRWYLKNPAYHVYIDCGDNGNYFIDGISSNNDVKKMDDEIKAVADKVIEGAKTQPDEYSKVRYVHDYLVDNISYDESMSGKNVHNMYGALVDKKCVCDGYSNAFQYFMKELGINSMNIPGYTSPSDDPTTYHQWNDVELDGNWYAVDVTWDDPVVGDEEMGNNTDDDKHAWFLIGDNELNVNNANHTLHLTSWRVYQYNYDRSTDWKVDENGQITINADLSSMDEMITQRADKIRNGDINININFPKINSTKYQ